MSDENDDGGPAFPHPWNADMGWSPRQAPGGMSLRDYFAAAALYGIAPNMYVSASPDEVAKRAYIIADAMLEARKAKP